MKILLNTLVLLVSQLSSSRMSSSLLQAIEELNLHLENGEVENIDKFLLESRARKRLQPSLNEIKINLEKEYLQPSTTFSTEWLNKLQQ